MILTEAKYKFRRQAIHQESKQLNLSTKKLLIIQQEWCIRKKNWGRSAPG